MNNDYHQDASAAMAVGRRHLSLWFGTYLAKQAPMRMVRSLALLLIVLGCLSQPAYAQIFKINGTTATGDNGAYIFPVQPGGNLAGNLPVGTVLGEQIQGYTLRVENFTCQLRRAFSIARQLVTGSTTTYQTSNPSIGVRFSVSSGFATSPYSILADNGGEAFVTPSNGQPASPTNAVTASFNFRVKAEFILVATPKAGSLGVAPQLILTWQGTACSGGSYTSYFNIPGGTTYTASTCTVSTPSLAVTMPTVFASQLKPIGTTAGSQSFSIVLNCAAGLKVGMTLTDLSNAANQTSSLGLMPSSTAQGVKLRILRSNTAISFGPDSSAPGNTNQMTVINLTTNGSASVPFTADYISVASTIVPGTVNAAATFTLSYL